MIDLLLVVVFYTGIDIDTMEGMLAAQSRCDVLMTIRPLKRVCYRWQISYSIHTSEGNYGRERVCKFKRV